MLTGDNARAGEVVGSEVQVDRVVAEALPEDKVREVVALQREGRVVAMAGDGINDAPRWRSSMAASRWVLPNAPGSREG